MFCAIYGFVIKCAVQSTKYTNPQIAWNLRYGPIPNPARFEAGRPALKCADPITDWKKLVAGFEVGLACFCYNKS